MGGKSSTVSSTSGPPSQFLNAYTDTYNTAKGLSQQPYQAYTGPMVAGFTPDQYAAYGTIRNSQGLAQPYFDQAASYMTAAGQPVSPMGFNVNGGDYSQFLPGVGLDYMTYAGKMADQAAAPIDLMDYNIDPYLSPYTENVTNALSNTFAQNNAEQYNQIRGNAGAQGAFGGDREAIAEAETARQQDLAQQQTIAGVQQAGFGQAQQEFNQQQAADLQRQLAQKQYALGAGQLGLGIGQGMWGEFNTQQQQDIGAQEASAYLQAGAGQGLASLGNLAQNSALGAAQTQLSAGQQQQQLEQQMLNVPYYQFMQQQAYPYQQAGWLANIAEGLGGASGGTSSTTYPGPSTLSQVAGLGTAGLGVYGLGSQQGWWGSGGSGGSGGYYNSPQFNSDVFSGWGQYSDPFMTGADGGAVARRAPGGAVGLGVPPEFGGAGIPMPGSYIPGASGMGAEPANKQGGGLSKMFMQPQTTQTQSGGGGGVLGGLTSIIGLGTKIAGLFDDGGSVVPRGTSLAQGYAGGGPTTRAAAPIVADLTHVVAPSSMGPATPDSVRSVQNYAPTFDAQGYPGALAPVAHDATVPPPLSIPMSNGMLNRAALGAPPPTMAPPMMSPIGLVPPDSHIGVPPLDMGGNLGGGGASGGHVGLGGIGHFDEGGSVPPVPLGMQDPATMLAEKIKRIQNLERIRLEDNWPSFQRLLSQQPKADGGLAYPDMSQGYIPALGAARPGMGPPKPPSLSQPPASQNSMSPIMDLLKGIKSSGILGGSLGGAVEPSATPLQYDDGGEVGMMRPMQQPPTQQRALLQQYASLPVEKLRELAMRYPATTPQGAAIQRALQMKQMMPTGTGTGPQGPYGPQGDVTPGTTAARGGMMGLAEGGPVPITPDSADMNIGRILAELRNDPGRPSWSDAMSASDRMRQELRDRVHPGFKGGGIADDDWIEPPPKDWTPGEATDRPRGLAEGGFPLFGPDTDDVKIVDVSSDEQQGPNVLPPLADVPSHEGSLGTPPDRATVSISGKPLSHVHPPLLPPDTKYNSRGEPYNLADAPGQQISAAQVTPERMQALGAANSTSATGGNPSGLAAIPDISGVPTNPEITPFGARSEVSATPSKAPEDVLYDRVRRAEGTAGGSGYVFYGGDSFTPGAEHPGELARRMGPQGVTHAAGPGQWQTGTWNGLKPDFRARFGRDPVFGDDGDQKSMVWLNAAKIYPGGEDKMRADIATGRLDTKALAPQWAGFNASDGTSGGTRTYASGIAPGYRAAVAGGPDQLVGPGTGRPGIGDAAATPASLANPPSYSLRTNDGPHTMRDIMSSPWAMLIATGAGMMASRSPFPGVALGEGLQTGLKMAQVGAAQEGKDDLNQVKLSSAQNQAKHMADMAEQARVRANETSSHNVATEQQQQQNAAIRAQSQADSIAVRQQLADAATQRAETALASAQSQAEARRIQSELRQQLADIQAGKGKWEQGKGIDPETGQEVTGMWHLPASGDKPQFEPGITLTKPSTGEKGILDQMVKDGLAKDIGEAQRMRAEYKRDPSGFKNSATYVSRVQTEEQRLQQRWNADINNIGKPVPNFRPQAEKQVQQMFSGAAAVTGAQAVPGQPAAAPAAAPAGPPAGAVVGGYRFKGGNPNDRSNWEAAQ